MGTSRTPVLAWAIDNLSDITVALGVAAGIVVLLYGARALVLRACKRLGPSHAFAGVFLDVVRRTRLWFLVALAVELVQGYLHPPQDVAKTIGFLFTVAAALQVAIWARALILGVIEHRAQGHPGDASSLASALGLIRLLVSIAVFAIAAIVVLDNLGANVTGLVAGLGIGGIAIGLAAQGIFSDLFAALSIIFDRPFRRGDGIRFDQLSGSVEQIGLKTTRIRSIDGEEVVISNTNLLNKQIHNFERLEHRRFMLRFGVVYQTAPDVLDAIPPTARQIVEGHDHCIFVRCGMTAFGPSSLDFELQFDVHTTDYEYAFATRSAICIEILRRFAAERIEFAYPTTVNFTAAPDGSLVEPYPQVKMIATEDLGT